MANTHNRMIGKVIPHSQSPAIRAKNVMDVKLVQNPCVLIQQTLIMWVVPELVGQALATVLMLVSLHWFVFLLNLPVAAWNMYRVWKVPMGNMGVFDPTEIHNRGQLKSHMKESMIKLGFHLLCFFIYLYSMILALIND
ncbi:cornichon homolog 4 isoform X2 [Oncorhynchus mykiss]|uniref:cornichon homolog 4 isoform X2 n=1 Tax=Oncorhynchus mykiss TaxID=8022 RepID=UPI00187817F5|nr:cornichon homolog 4 isoform X2 [Oncorhynchus mykiss]